MCNVRDANISVIVWSKLMAILRRVDGVQFAIQPYRTVLDLKKKSLIKNEVLNLALEHGNYVRLYRSKHKQYAAIFSWDPGFLLGETIWQHFQCPDNLVYCELMGENQALLVIVKTGKVIVDRQLDVANIVKEITPLISEDAKFAVYTYGKVPISSGNAENAFIFHENNLVSFNHLSEPLFRSLHVSQQYQLLPLSLALKEYRLNNSYKLSMTIMALLIIMSIITWLLLSYVQ
jgi:hypothetical protein